MCYFRATVTLINFFKSMLGPGSLTIPMAFKQSGLWAGFTLVFALGYLSNYSMHQLVYCSQHLSRRKALSGLTYGTLAQHAFTDSIYEGTRSYANVAKAVVNWSIFLLQLGVCCVQYDFISSHLQELIPLEHPFGARSFTFWPLIIAVPLLLLVNLARDNLRRIAVLSAIGNACVIASFVCIFGYIIIPPYHTDELPFVTNPIGMIQASGAILYAFEGQTMVLPMENKLRHSRDMTSPFGVLDTGMSLVSIVLAGMGFLGYAKYGNGIRGSLTLNLPDNSLFTAVKAVFILVAFINYVLMQYVVAEEAVPYLKRKYRDARLNQPSPSQGGSDVPPSNSPPLLDTAASSPLSSDSRWHDLGVVMAFRTAMILLTMTIAILVPNIDQIIPLVGFSAGMCLAFVFPALFDTLIFVPTCSEAESPDVGAEGEENQRRVVINWWRLVRNVAFMAVGIIGGGTGLVFTVIDIAKAHMS